MLTSFRIPVVDGRHFAADGRVASSVVLPPSWADGDFVRGLGRVIRRPLGAVDPWSLEGAYADLQRTLVVDPHAVQRFNAPPSEFRIDNVRKRAWLALPATPALLDVDVAIQLSARSGTAHPRRVAMGSELSLVAVAEAIGCAAALPVTVRGASTTPLLISGRTIASRFSLQTAQVTSDPHADLVKAGATSVVVEAPGYFIDHRTEIPCHYLETEGVQLASLTVRVPSGGSVRCHVLGTSGQTKEDRKRVREMRIHILRLHSIYEFMKFLASPTHSGPNSPLAHVETSTGFSALQQALLTCVRTVNSRKAPGGIDAATLLDVAFSAQNFADRDLQVMLDRTIASMRPRVRREIEAFIQAEKDRERNTVAIYHINNSAVGAIGDNARSINSTVGGHDNVILAGRTISRTQLLVDLETIRQAASGGRTGAPTDVIENLEIAEGSLRSGDTAGALAALRKAGEWALTTATTIGANVAAAAIKVAIGLG